MFEINEDKTINITRGDIGAFTVDALNEEGEKYIFQKGDVVRIKVTEKKACENVMFQKDFVVEEETEQVELLLTEEETKIGEVISKPTDYWYEIEINPLTNPQTIIGYDEDGAKIFKLFPEGKDVEPEEPTPEDIPVVDTELDLTSERPVQNQAIARAFLNMQEEIERINNDTNITSEDLEPLKSDIEANKTNIAKNTGSIEDLTNNVEELNNHKANTSNPHNVTAEQISIDNTISGLSANKMQGAIDEIKSTIGYTSTNELPYPHRVFTAPSSQIYISDNVYTYAGISWTDNGDGTVTANNTATAKAACFLRSRLEENYSLTKGKRLLTGCPQGGSESTYCLEIGKTGSDGNFELIGYDYGDGLEFELEEDTNNIAVTAVIQSGVTVENLVFKPMIVPASLGKIPFEPYVADLKTLSVKSYISPSETLNIGASAYVQPTIALPSGVNEVLAVTPICEDTSQVSVFVNYVDTAKVYLRVRNLTSSAITPKVKALVMYR